MSMADLFNTEEEIQGRIAYLRERIEELNGDSFLIYGLCHEIQELQNKIPVDR